MQYVGQTCRTLQKRFGEHYRRIRKPKNNDTFLYQHFKRTGHSPNNVIVQPVEKISYDENSKSILLWWFFLFYVLVFKIFLCCWRPMYVCIFLVKFR